MGHGMGADLMAVFHGLLHPRPQQPDLKLVEESLFRRRILLGADEERPLDVVLVHRIGGIDDQLGRIVDRVHDDGACVVEVFRLADEVHHTGLSGWSPGRTQHRDDRRDGGERDRDPSHGGSSLTRSRDVGVNILRESAVVSRTAIGARLRGAHRWPDRQPACDVVSCGRLAGGRHPVARRD